MDNESKSDRGTAPVYVNHCKVNAGLSDATLIFSQAGDGQEEPIVKSHVVTSPTHLKRFRDVIADACDAHDARFRTVPPGELG